VARKGPFFDDMGLALVLLQGRLVEKKGRPVIAYLSPQHQAEAQAALARLLAAFAKKLTKGTIRNEQLRHELAKILANLAQLFDARAPIDANLRSFLYMLPPTLKVAKLTRLSKGHANPLDFWVVLEVEELIKAGRPKLEAYRTVARKCRIGQRRVEQICGRMERLWRSGKSVFGSTKITRSTI
jgi:hypothetical protein